MLEIIVILSVYSIGQKIANKRGYPSPLWGVIPVLYFYTIGSIISGFYYELYFNAEYYIYINTEKTYNEIIQENGGTNYLIYSAIFYLFSFLSTLIIYIILLFLPKKNLRSSQRKRRTKIPYKIIGLLILIIVVCFSLFMMINKRLNPVTPFTFFFTGISIHLLRLSKKNKVMNVNEVLMSDNRKPNVFLRSFNIDENCYYEKTKYFIKIKTTFQEAISSSINLTGPLIAIGDPEDYLPSLGAAKIYKNDNNWKNTIIDFIEKSNKVFIVPDNTVGLEWEINYIYNNIQKNKIVILIPPLSFDQCSCINDNIDDTVNNFKFDIKNTSNGAIITYDEFNKKIIVSKNIINVSSFLYMLEIFIVRDRIIQIDISSKDFTDNMNNIQKINIKSLICTLIKSLGKNELKIIFSKLKEGNKSLTSLFMNLLIFINSIIKVYIKQHSKKTPNYLGYIFLIGEGVRANDKKAFKLTYKASNLGDSDAINRLGFHYEYGVGTNIDLKAACNSYKKASEMGNISAKYNLEKFQLEQKIEVSRTTPEHIFIHD